MENRNISEDTIPLTQNIQQENKFGKKKVLLVFVAGVILLLVGVSFGLAFQNIQLKKQLQIIQFPPTPSPILSQSTPTVILKPKANPTMAVFKKEIVFGEKVKLTPGQRVEVANSSLSITLIRIEPAPEGSHDYPTRAFLEVKNDQDSQEIKFISGVIATEEVAKKLSYQEVLGFRITREMLNSEAIIISVAQL